MRAGRDYNMGKGLATMFCSKIVIAYNDTELSNKALQTARKIAEQDGGIAIDILYVFEPPIPVTYESLRGYQALLENESQYAQTVVEKAAKAFEGMPNPVQTFIAHGNPSHVILNHVKEQQNDLIIMGNRGLKGVKEFFSSVSHTVVQESPVPVLLVK